MFPRPSLLLKKSVIAVRFAEGMCEEITMLRSSCGWLSLRTLFDETMQMSSKMASTCAASIIVWRGCSSESLGPLSGNSPLHPKFGNDNHYLSLCQQWQHHCLLRTNRTGTHQLAQCACLALRHFQHWPPHLGQLCRARSRYA